MKDHEEMQLRLIGLGVVLIVGVMGVRWALAEAATAPAEVANAIVGTISSESPVRKLVAVDRSLADIQRVTKGLDDPAVFAATIDAASGAFVIPNLLAGHTYDLIAWTDAGRWEGVNMEYHRDIEPAELFTAEDKKWITDFIEKTPEFYDQVRLLRLAADHKHATALVELRRTRGFVNQQEGETIYRVELWYFENYFGGWAKDKNTEVVLARYRGPAEGLPKVWQFVPAMGGIALDAMGRAAPVKVVLPKVDGRRGLSEKK